jgi:HAD superfamily hydrolase (TIGR01484 family)
LSNIKLVLTDIDGTLVPHNTHLPTKAVVEAISKVQAADILVTPATGRPFEMVKELFKNFNFEGLGVFDAGASVINIETGEHVWKNWLDSERLRAIAEILLPYSTLVDFFPKQRLAKPITVQSSQLKDPAPYAYAHVRYEARLEVEERLNRIPGLSVHVGMGGDTANGIFDIQITDINSDKHHAVTALREIVHSEYKNTLAIGDSSNDLPLFESAAVKVAMGNAIDELKSISTYIVGDVVDDGFVEAMEKYVLS